MDVNPQEVTHAAGSYGGASSSSPSLVGAEPGHEFEVFLSFRGADNRQTFTDCLFHSLVDLGVRTFRDNEELRVGKEIGPDLMRAIKQSKISVPIFSRHYADSKWCLKEVSEMVKCVKETNDVDHRVIIPVFFDVTPDEVQHQTGAYSDAFAEHERRYDSETVQGWRDALKEVTKLKGLELDKVTNGNQGEFIKWVVAEVLRELRTQWLNNDEIQVGLDDPAEEVTQLLKANGKDIHMVGMWGIGGIGKTTLAKYVYNRIAGNFECCSFLRNIRETFENTGGLLSLQRKLVSDILGHGKYDFASTDEGTNVLKSRLRGKKVLILLDDPDHVNQLQALAGDLGWFGSGSRILVTTRDKEVLLRFQECSIYEVKLLDKAQAFELFRKHAFRNEVPSGELVDLSGEIVSTTGGLPLALEVIGSFLFVHRENKSVWHETIEELKRKPHDDVQGKLMISYDALQDKHKEIFLDIACHFIGTSYEVVIPMWKDCLFSPILGLEVLQFRSLIKIGSNNELQMHDQLRDLGRHIVKQKNERQLGQQTRLWRSEEAIDVLQKKQGTSKVEAVAIQIEEKINFSSECFENLEGLRILQLCGGGAALVGNFEKLLPNLRWLTLQRLNLPRNLHLNNLSVLILSGSSVKEDWKGWRSMERLKVLDLSFCYNLRKTPHFSAFPNLERLIISYCRKLVSIDPSIGVLKNLNYLHLSDCSKLKKLPDELGYLEALGVLIVDNTSVVEIPVSARMKKLETLSASYCGLLERLPADISSLSHLQTLTFDNCCSLQCLPEPPPGLINLSVDGQSFSTRAFPYLASLVNLKMLHLKNVCLRSQCLSKLCKLEILRLDEVDIGSLPEEVGAFPLLKEIIIQECSRLKFLVTLPSSLCSLSLKRCYSLRRLPNLSNLRKLSKLYIDECPDLREIDGLGDLISLQELHISGYPSVMLDSVEGIGSLRKLSIGTYNVERPPYLSNLRKLIISDCEELCQLEGLEELSSLEILEIKRCNSIEKLPDLSNLRNLLVLKVESCENLRQLEGLGRLGSLQELEIKRCTSIKTLPDLSKLQSLKQLNMYDCKKLCQIDGLGELKSLVHLSVKWCEEIVQFSDLSKLQDLEMLRIHGCKKLRQINGLGELKSLVHLSMSFCEEIVQLSDLSKLQNLEYLDMDDCENLREVKGLEKLKNLRELSASGCKSLHLGTWTWLTKVVIPKIQYPFY